ncbi:sensor histidine kinase [Paenibacillus sp. MMS18-CY102]|uniref:sensor histidine kinase n=1 Tax=Paenibacillus sp. MMS18-CY102 TaxID=2682849 RepID=UPI001365E438|nr:HAMP domain-containing sensor histidine kinase [Paenibacillus sp. MMS18-CY102]MWC26788.1 hypothetical protein [Paenibacillus sp. MMS18-CY102]
MIAKWKERLSKEWVGMAGISLAVCLLFIGSSIFIQQQSAIAEHERLALYWNRYASNYYVTFGDWKGIGEQLRSEAAAYPDGMAHSIVIWDTGNERVANIGDSEASADGRTPVVSNGKIVGYTAVSSQGNNSVYAFPIVSAILIGIIVYLLLFGYGSSRKSHWNRTVGRLTLQAQALTAQSAQQTQRNRRSHAATQVPDGEPLAELEWQLSVAHGYVRKLETVRRSMVADIAHELRTPIAVMRSQLENGLNAGEPLSLERIGALHDETLYLSKLVRDMQDLALAEAGKLPLDKRWFSLTDMSNAIIGVFAMEAEERGLQLKLELETGKEIAVYADPVRLRQLIVNLLGNAIRHARSCVFLRVGTDGSHIACSIQDDGLGIEEEQLPRLFERFYRGDAIHEGRSRGLGLGLAIAKQYAEAHGGEIAVTSNWGEGATFTVTLPVMAD